MDNFYYDDREIITDSAFCKEVELLNSHLQKFSIKYKTKTIAFLPPYSLIPLHNFAFVFPENRRIKQLMKLVLRLFYSEEMGAKKYTIYMKIGDPQIKQVSLVLSILFLKELIKSINESQIKKITKPFLIEKGKYIINSFRNAEDPYINQYYEFYDTFIQYFHIKEKNKIELFSFVSWGNMFYTRIIHPNHLLNAPLKECINFFGLLFIDLQIPKNIY